MELETLILPLKSEDNAFRAGIARATQLVEGLVDFLADSVSEATASEEAMAQLGAVLKSTGGAAGVTAKMANELASAFQATTKFSDEAILSGESMLLTFTNIGKDVFPLATQTMLDMSQALGQDLKASAVQLGKALNDPKKGITALQRVGVTFNEEQQKMIDKMVESGDLMGAQTMILDELQKEFGGSAEAAGQTFGGQLEILKNRMSDIKETIGGAIIPVLSTLGGVFMDVFDTPQFQGFLDTVLGGLERVGNWVQKTGLPAFLDFGEELKRSFDKGGLVGFVDTLLDAFDEIDLTAVSQSIAGAISSIDWSQAGMDFSALVTRVGESLAEAFGEGDVLGVGNSLASALNNFIAGALFGTDEAGLQIIVQTKLAEIRTEFELWANGMPSSLDGLDAGINNVVSNALLSMYQTVQGKLNEAASTFVTWATVSVPTSLSSFAANLITVVTGALGGFTILVDGKLRDIAKTFFNRGQGWSQQAALGFLNNMNTILGAVQTVVNAINNILKKIITSFTIRINVPTITTGGGGGGNTPPATTTTPTTSTGTTGGGNKNRNRDRRASGGPVIAGQTYDVSEFFHPERFTPNVSGRVDPIRPSGPQVVVVSNWDDFDYFRLAAEIIKASNQ